MSSSANTRMHSKCPIFGDPCDLFGHQLPSYRDVMKCYLHKRNEKLNALNGYNPSVAVIASEIATAVQEIYRKASIPCVTHKRIVAKIKEYHERYRKLLKIFNSRKDLNGDESKISRFYDDSKKLFDFVSCKCKTFDDCRCNKDLKIPVIERDFVVDQRNERRMFIGNTDQKITNAQKRRLERLMKEPRKVPKLMDTIQITDSSSQSTSDASADEYIPVTHKRKSTNIVANEGDSSKSSKRPRLSNLALACDRTGVSDRAAALISSSVLQDYGFITASSSNDVIDRSKIRRERSDSRRRNTDLDVCENEIESIYFDGRKDETLVNEKIGSTYHPKTKMEEHISIVSEPGNNFLGHVSVSRGTSQCISRAMLDFLSEKKIATESIKAIGCDGTAVNTGSKGGVIRQLELKLEKPLHWFVCQLHANELPLRHLIQKLDGKTTGPRGYTGVIGKELENCEKQQVVKFAAIESDMPEVSEDVVEQLSTDQKYLYEMVTAVSKGHVPERLARTTPGKMAHSRWLTTASRVLRLYVTKTEPFEHLRTIANYVASVYTPGWFIIKLNSGAEMGCRNLNNVLKLCNKFLEDDVFEVVKPVIQRNAFFAHPENILIAMINDERPHIRELAWRRVLKARSQSSEVVRQFKLPEINFDAEDYVAMINWQSVTVTEPPLTRDIPETELRKNIENKARLEFKKFPCHTQCVERMIKLVTESSKKVSGVENRDGFVKSKLASYKRMAKFETKKDYAT